MTNLFELDEQEEKLNEDNEWLRALEDEESGRGLIAPRKRKIDPRFLNQNQRRAIGR